MNTRKRRTGTSVGVTKCFHIVDRASDSVIVKCDVGAKIDDVAKGAVRLAKAANLHVQFAFNGFVLAAHEASEPDNLVRAYQHQIDQLLATLCIGREDTGYRGLRQAFDYTT
jgi:hypothetical protein